MGEHNAVPEPHRRVIQIVPYDSAWPLLFMEEKKRLLAVPQLHFAAI